MEEHRMGGYLIPTWHGSEKYCYRDLIFEKVKNGWDFISIGILEVHVWKKGISSLSEDGGRM